MNLPSVASVPQAKTIWLRLDLDLPFTDRLILDNSRLKKSLPTIQALLGQSSRLLIVGHRGRPAGPDSNFSLRPVYLELLNLLGNPENLSSVFIDNLADFEKISTALSQNQLVFGENLRFLPGELASDESLARSWADLVDLVVNDAIAAYRPQASVTLISRLKPLFFGFDFLAQYQQMEKIRNESPRPLGLILGGAKADKLELLNELLVWADFVFLSGLLPEKLDPHFQHPKLLSATLASDRLDISSDSLDRLLLRLPDLKTLIWAGPLGKIEDQLGQTASLQLAQSAHSLGLNLISAGGDTAAFLSQHNFSFSSPSLSGAGALLHFLAKGHLPLTQLFFSSSA